MSPRLSLRAQIALYLGLTLLLGSAVNLPVASSILRRAMAGEARRTLSASALALSRQARAACPGLEPRCFAGAVTNLSSPDLTVEVAPASTLAGPPDLLASSPLTPELSLHVRRNEVEARRRLDGALSLLVAYLLLGALFVFVVGSFLLNRAIAGPLDKLTAAAERIGKLELENPLEGDGPELGRLGVAFERMAHSLKEERGRVTAQISELTRLNRELADARDSLLRSEKLATVGRLAAGVAHEVGNPLGAILGYLELARMKPVPDDVKDYLARIDREVGRIDRTVRELLDFSREGPPQSSAQSLPLKAAVEAAVSLARVQKRLRLVEFELDIAAEVRVLADEHHLSQVLVNLLLNAGDAMGGEGRVKVRALAGATVGPRLRAADPAPGGRVELVVLDSGPGIREADLARIFDPFFTTKEPGEGTGLGLAICHRIMESFGGEIRAANPPGGGAAFTLVFREPPPAGV